MRPILDKFMGREEPARPFFPSGLSWGQGHGTRKNLQGSSSPRGCPGGPICPFPLSVLLLLSFLLIFGNVIYSNKASLEKSKPI